MYFYNIRLLKKDLIMFSAQVNLTSFDAYVVKRLY